MKVIRNLFFRWGTVNGVAAGKQRVFCWVLLKWVRVMLRLMDQQVAQQGAEDWLIDEAKLRATVPQNRFGGGGT